MTIATINPAKEYVSVPLPPDEVLDALDSDDLPQSSDKESTLLTRSKGPRWEPLANYPQIGEGYELSDRGQVKGPRGNVLRPNTQGQSHWVSVRGADGGTTSARVDKLMLATFDHWEPLMIPEHIDGNTFNNRADNLRWREPTEAEMGPLILQEERRQGLRPKVGRRPMNGPIRKSPKLKENNNEARPRNRSPKQTPAIQMTRRYVFEDVSIEVNEEGAMVKVSPDPNRGDGLTAHQTMLLCQLMARVHEMNLVMGVQ